MRRKELLDGLKSVRDQTEAVLAELSHAQLTAPGALGAWSVKDVLAHITAWEVDTLTNIGKVERRVKPGTTRWSAASIQAQNERHHSEMKDRPLERVRADFDGARRQMRRLLGSLSDADVEQAAGWLQGRSVGEYVASQTLEHEREHLPHLQDWQARQAGASSNGKE